MPSSVFFGMQHLNNNLICAMGFDATAADPERGEIIELACVPLDRFLKIHDELPLFNMKIRPNRLEDIDWKYTRYTRPEMAALCTTGIDRDKVADLFLEWYRMMNMPRFKKVMPLAHNFPELRQHLLAWLGWDVYDEIFHEQYRDTLVLANGINDAFDVRGNVVPFSKQNLSWLARQLDVQKHEMGGSPCMDANTVSEVYKRLLQSMP